MLRSVAIRTLGRIIAVLSSGVAVAAALPAAPPASVPSKHTQPASQPAIDPQVDRILTRLEDKDVRDLRAKVRWELEYVIEEEPTIKFGEIWYQKADPVPRFRVRFTRKIIGDRATSRIEDHFFDGQWYVQVEEQTRTITRRQIRCPGDDYNPYRLGEGTFPTPFGQRKADILREFQVERVPPAPSDPRDTDHLRLTPRPLSRLADEYARIDFWVARSGEIAGLPIRVRAAKLAGTGEVNHYLTITFSRVELNTGFAGTVFRVRTPAGYQEEVEPKDCGDGAAP